jgi:hypothetical protein
MNRASSRLQPLARIGCQSRLLHSSIGMGQACASLTTLQVARIGTNDPKHLRVEIRSRPPELERSCASGAEIVASPAAAVGGGRKPVWAPPEVTSDR